MNDLHDLAPLVALPIDLDDDAAAKLLEFFYQAARVLEAHYAGQLLRSYHTPDERQHALWEDDPPF
jgi:hypothetical protein